jgi:flagellar motor switch protein FliM
MPDKMLDQHDIDSLFVAARENVPQTAAVTEQQLRDEAYNFSRAGLINDEQMKAISGVNDFFARNLMHTVGAWLRTQFQVKLVSGEQLPYTEFLDRISDPTYLCSVRLEPLGALGLIEFDLTLASPIIDVLLGGIGTSSPVRELTDIEEDILSSVMEIIVRELNTAWMTIGLEFKFERRESAGRAARMMPLAEKTLCVSFEVRMPEVQGALNLCLPAVVLNSILRKLGEDRDRTRSQPRDIQIRLRDLLADTTVGMVLQFPPMKLPARELATIVPGTILRLPLSRYEMAEIRARGLPLARAHPVRSGEHRGAQIVHFATDKIGTPPATLMH